MANLGPLNLKDITRSALERIVMQLITADESDEKKILDQLKQEPSDSEKESNDLADLREEKRGKPSPVSTEDEPKRKGGR
jgi:hypothetical protein